MFHRCSVSRLGELYREFIFSASIESIGVCVQLYRRIQRIAGGHGDEIGPSPIIHGKVLNAPFFLSEKARRTLCPSHGQCHRIHPHSNQAVVFYRDFCILVASTSNEGLSIQGLLSVVEEGQSTPKVYEPQFHRAKPSAESIGQNAGE